MKKNYLTNFENLKEDCKKLILIKEMDLDDLSFALGTSPQNFVYLFKNSKDFTFFLHTYHILLEWQV